VCNYEKQNSQSNERDFDVGAVEVDHCDQRGGGQKMPGPKAMTAVARKFLKMIWG